MSNVENNSPNEHISVLGQVLVEQIRLPQDGAMVDATLGHGGHSLLFGRQLGPEGMLLGLDVDEKCLARAQMQLSELTCRTLLVRSNFSELGQVIEEHCPGKFDLILADLGFCSAQLKDPLKGLSFQENMKLDMRLDSRLKISAADIVNTSDEKSLADLIYKYGEDRASRRISRFIVEHRQNQPIRTTGQLAAVVCKSLNLPATGRKWKIHPATRTFQALRIAVNDELGSLERLLESSTGVLKAGGYIAIISFHSLEDRIVKEDFKRKKSEGLYEVVTKKPLVADRQEVAVNPRSRSAKLRIARLKQQQ